MFDNTDIINKNTHLTILLKFIFLGRSKFASVDNTALFPFIPNTAFLNLLKNF